MFEEQVAYIKTLWSTFFINVNSDRIRIFKKSQKQVILVVLKAAISTGGTKFGRERRHESIQSTDYSDCKGVSHLWGYNEWPLTLCGREAEVTLVLYTCMMVKCFLSKVRWILWGGKAEKPGRRNKEKRRSAHGAFPFLCWFLIPQG